MNATEQPREPIWYCVRRHGTASRSGWIRTVPVDELPRHVGAGADSVVEVCRTTEYRPVELRTFSRVFCNRARGLLGMEIAFRGEVQRYAPTRILADNLGFRRALERFLGDRGTSVEDFGQGGSLHAFSARQQLLHCDSGAVRVTELYRGAPLVAAAPESARECASDLAEGIAAWMVRNQSADGSLPYKYWPSRGTQSPADNAIRRFLASLALARFGELRGSAEIREAARRNLRHNLRRYFRPIGGGRGAIVEDTGAKLGAAALAALAILESPASREFLPELEMLAAGVESLSGGERGFRTFFFPAGRDGSNWNFYSGEALLSGPRPCVAIGSSHRRSNDSRISSRAAANSTTGPETLRSCPGIRKRVRRCSSRRDGKRSPTSRSR